MLASVGKDTARIDVGVSVSDALDQMPLAIPGFNLLQQFVPVCRIGIGVGGTVSKLQIAAAWLGYLPNPGVGIARDCGTQTVWIFDVIRHTAG